MIFENRLMNAAARTLAVGFATAALLSGSALHLHAQRMGAFAGPISGISCDAQEGQRMPIS